MGEGATTMSTCYSTLRSPVTHIEVEGDCVRISVNHLVTGVLVVPEDQLPDFLRLFFNDNDAITTTGTGIHTQYDTRHWRDDVVLLSEYNELTTWAAIKERYQ